MLIERLRYPIVQAPMAGGPSTVELAAAVSAAGGLGFLATGMTAPTQVADDLAALRAALPAGTPFGVNLFCPSPRPADPAAVAAYADRIAPIAQAVGAALGEPRFHDDRYPDKLALVLADPPPVVSFVFGCPVDDIARVRAAGAEAWVTVTQVDEARQAVAAGADALVVQGSEAGGHRGGFVDDDREPVPLAQLLAVVRSAEPGVPLVAAGALMTAAGVQGALDAGAAAAQCGTAFLLTDEAGTSAVHAAGVASDRPTEITRAFSGRRARGVANAWLTGVGRSAPSAYPEVLELTKPLREAARAAGDLEHLSLWAGTRHAEARTGPAADVVTSLGDGLHAI